MLTKSAIRKNYIDKYPSISVPTKVAENASVGAQNQRFLNELHGESVKHGLGLTFWLSVKDSTNPAVLATYLERYPTGEFSAIARTLADHYDRKLKAEQAAREEEHKRKEDERKAAEVKRLEEERRAREAAIAEDRKRAEEGKSSEEVRRLEEQQRAELVARTEELRKALEEARLAREAAKAAEEQRVEAMKAAEEATKAADEAIALKRDAERHSDPSKVAALPKLDHPRPKAPKAWNPHDMSRTVTPGGYKTCGPRGCQTVPKGCHAVRRAGGGGLGGKIFCP